MSELSPEARNLLARARVGLASRPADRSRVERALAIQLGLGATVAVAGTTSAAKAAGAGATKWIVSMVLLGALGAGGLWTYRSTRSQSPSSVPIATAPTLAVVQPKPTVTASASTIDDSLPALAAPTESAAPAPPSAAIAKTAAPPTKVAGSVADEARLLREANAALHAGNGAGALALLDEHQRKYPNGALSEERAAERVFALCTLGRVDQARREAVSFLKWHPKSLFAKSIRESCGMPKTTP